MEKCILCDSKTFEYDRHFYMPPNEGGRRLMFVANGLLELAIFLFCLVAGVKLIGLGCHWIREIIDGVRSRGDKIIQNSFAEPKKDENVPG